MAVAYVAVLIWSCRLTWNFWRGWDGGYEDWRYANLRRQWPTLYWGISFCGVHLMPTLLVWMGCLPIYYRRVGGLWSFQDFLGGVVMASAIALETVADAQLHHFRRTRRSPSEVLRSGVWSWCRHPNYAGEICLWLGLACLLGDLFAWQSWVGSIAMITLFTFISIPLIEAKLKANKPAYEEYTVQVRFALLPLSRLL